MQVACFNRLEEIAPYADDWDRLNDGVPFRSWTWLSTWWKHYGGHDERPRPNRRLHVLGVFDHTDTLVGVAPWYIEHTTPWGDVIRPLGSGEVCSDYLSVLCQRGAEDPVTEALAEQLTADAQAGVDPCRWDLLELTGFDARDGVIGQLAENLAHRGNTVHRRPGPNCWRIELPSTWDEYVARLSKSHRKQLRRLERNILATDRAKLHVVGRVDELPGAIEILVDLHQQRRRALGEPGCFASQQFDAFHRAVMPELLRNGQLLLSWLELDGQPAAVEYQLSGGGVVYAYQAGVDPQRLDEEPGRLITLATLRRAVEQGYRAFDLLRGDEPYKAHWRGESRPSLEVRVVPDRAAAQLRHGLWLAGSNVKRWAKNGLRLAGN